MKLKVKRLKRKIIESNYQAFTWHRFQDDLPTIGAILHMIIVSQSPIYEPYDFFLLLEKQGHHQKTLLTFGFLDYIQP